MLLAELVTASDAVAATSSRTEKIDLIASLLRRLGADEIGPAVGYLSGVIRQGRVGVGWALLAKVDVPPADTPSLQVVDLDELLSALAATTGTGSAAKRSLLLETFFARATAPEASLARRVILGDLRQGALEGIAADALARAAEVPSTVVRRALMLRGDLCATAEIAMRDGAEGLKAVGLEVLRPVQPMLASTSSDVDEALGATGLASVEWKLDGIRIQVHRNGDVVKVFTRNLNEITDRVPEILAITLDLDVRAVVLDGEAMALGDDERPQLFQAIASRVGTRSRPHETALVPYFFDVLHVDGDDLMDTPLGERSGMLDRIASRWRIPATTTDDAEVAKRVLAQALQAGHEGIMVKAIGSAYQAGRRGKSWRKVKIARTFDLVVLGAEWGYGRRTGWLSNIHLGARDPAGGFVMVGKTFKGMTDEMLRAQTERFLQIESSRAGNVVYVKPEIVVEIELDGVQVSTRYPGGVALRFARVLRYRDDKSPSQADTIDAVRALLGDSSASPSSSEST